MIDMFINISSDRILFLQQEESIQLPYGDMEVHMPDMLYTRFGERMQSDKKIVVLNGPGSFTNIRIATLALNTYNTLHNFGLDFLSIDKMQRYKILYTLGKVSQYGLIYIGQKKYYWLVDFAKVIVGTDEGIEKVHIETDRERLQNLGDMLFVDELFAEAKESLVDLVQGGAKVFHTSIDIVEEVLSTVEISPEKLLQANYMIEANVS